MKEMIMDKARQEQVIRALKERLFGKFCGNDSGEMGR
jgi:hypothetical protein